VYDDPALIPDRGPDPDWGERIEPTVWTVGGEGTPGQPPERVHIRGASCGHAVTIVISAQHVPDLIRMLCGAAMKPVKS
jgi:hypothetical protein